MHYPENSCEEVTMAGSIKIKSTLTDRYQTTVPSAVRQALKLGKRDKLQYVLHPSGTITLTRGEPETDDPAIGAYLTLLAHDIATHPKHVRAVAPSLVARIRALTRHAEIDLEAPLSPDDE
jgi:antitoxin PrlF